jgi:hypothetical protein
MKLIKKIVPPASNTASPEIQTEPPNISKQASVFHKNNEMKNCNTKWYEMR